MPSKRGLAFSCCYGPVLSESAAFTCLYLLTGS